MADVIRTSTTHPLRVDWLPLEGEGRVGMTFAPGKKAWSRYSDGRWERDMEPDLARLRAHHHVDVLVSLIEDRELGAYGLQGLFERVPAHGLDLIRFPVRDADVRREGLRDLVDNILRRAAGGETIVVHCIGGLGRTGMVCGCVLVADGSSTEYAFETLRDLRGPRCPETEAQRDVIRRFGWPPDEPFENDLMLPVALEGSGVWEEDIDHHDPSKSFERYSAVKDWRRVEIMLQTDDGRRRATAWVFESTTGPGAGYVVARWVRGERRP